NHFENIIKGSVIVVYTDNMNIINYDAAEYNRLKNWKGILKDFNVELKHIKGAENIIPDTISRLNIIKVKVENIKNQFINMNLKEIHKKTGHPGIFKTFKLQNLLLENPASRRKIIRLINNCEICQKIKPLICNYGKFYSTIIAKSPCETIATEIAGPLQ
ncbi:hypothetical protein DMUE_4696, partial [Dictyocoela muelleri]